MMNASYVACAPDKLYAFFLKLRPLRPGTLMPFSGELVHGAWLHWLGCVAPDVATGLHEGNKRRFLPVQACNFHFPPDVL